MFLSEMSGYSKYIHKLANINSGFSSKSFDCKTYKISWFSNFLGFGIADKEFWSQVSEPE